MEMRSNHRVLCPCHVRGDTRGPNGVCSGGGGKEGTCGAQNADEIMGNHRAGYSEYLIHADIFMALDMCPDLGNEKKFGKKYRER